MQSVPFDGAPDGLIVIQLSRHFIATCRSLHQVVGCPQQLGPFASPDTRRPASRRLQLWPPGSQLPAGYLAPTVRDSSRRRLFSHRASCGLNRPSPFPSPPSGQLTGTSSSSSSSSPEPSINCFGCNRARATQFGPNELELNSPTH